MGYVTIETSACNVPAIMPSPRTPTTKDCCVQTLSMIAPKSCTKKIFARASYLKKLGIRDNVIDLLDSKLKILESLKFVNDVLYTGKLITLPTLVFIFPKTLRKLTFAGTRLEWSKMSKLGQLESLEVVKLKENAFKGEFWEPEIGGFSNLLTLWIGRTDLRTWRASSRNFPSLKRLVLISCDNLEGIPESMVDIPFLEEMRLENTHKEAVKSARKIEAKKLELRA